eukprot:gene5497-gene6056
MRRAFFFCSATKSCSFFFSASIAFVLPSSASFRRSNSWKTFSAVCRSFSPESRASASMRSRSRSERSIFVCSSLFWLKRLVFSTCSSLLASSMLFLLRLSTLFCVSRSRLRACSARSCSSMPATWSCAWRCASSCACNFSRIWYCFSLRTRSCSCRASTSICVFILSSVFCCFSCSTSTRSRRISSARSWPSLAAFVANSSCVLAVVSSAEYFWRISSSSARSSATSPCSCAVTLSSLSKSRRSSDVWSVMIRSCLSLSATSICTRLATVSADFALLCSSKLVSRSVRFSCSMAIFSS